MQLLIQEFWIDKPSVPLASWSDAPCWTSDGHIPRWWSASGRSTTDASHRPSSQTGTARAATGMGNVPIPEHSSSRYSSRTDKIRIMERLPEDQSFGIRMEHIDGCIIFHVLFHIYKCCKQEFIEILIRHVVILDLSSGFFYIYIVGRIGKNQDWLSALP